jgi:xanthine dehydrogenase accessory factor
MTREQPWSDDDSARGRIVLLTRNPIAEAIAVIGSTAGREVTVIAEDADGQGVEALSRLDLHSNDAVVLCDHDAPDAPQALRAALASPASYVAMMASRRRAAGLLADLEQDGTPGLDRLHVPAGLDTGGKAPGEIALSVVAEIVACSYGRSGGSMRQASTS